MISWIFSLLIITSTLFSVFSGRASQVSSAVLKSGLDAMELSITLIASMCFWSGLLNIAKKSGLTDIISGLLSPLTNLLFKKAKSAVPLISMNMSANILGLGNSATPFGLAAMKELDNINHHSDTASKEMVFFVVLNTASIQIIPTTTAMLRSAAGSETPFAIVPAVLFASAVSLMSALLAAKIFSLFSLNSKQDRL